MKKLIVAFLYNVRHHYPDPNDPRTHLEVDFDDPQTIEAMIKNLQACGYQVIPIEADQNAYFKLFENKNKIDLAFNYSEGIYGQDREAQLPAILEMLQIPYTGSPPLTQALGLNKAKTKEVLQSHQIPVLPHQVFKTSQEKLERGLFFPLIVKPIAQGSSAGITNSSVVFNNQELKKQVKFVIQTFYQPALVEPFLAGREFSVAMLGNPPKILPIIESDHTILPPQYLPLDSLEVKWIFEEENEVNNVVCPAKIAPRLKEKITQICLKVWEALGVLDLCRIDLRCDQNLNPYVLEINSPPGLLPPEISTTGKFPLAARVAGLSYEKLLKTIIKNALARYNDILARTPIIRKINLDDPEEIRRVAVIDRNREVLKYMVGNELNEKELLKFVTDDKNKTLYVVSGYKGVPQEEIGKLQGWILIYSGKEVTERARRALGRKILDSNFSIIEVSYAKYPTAFPGQIASGLRQVLLDLARKSGGDLRKGLMPPILVTAYVSPENEKSRHVLEVAGFTLQPKKIIWDSKESKKKDLVYFLDWKRLRGKIFASRKKSIFLEVNSPASLEPPETVKE